MLNKIFNSRNYLTYTLNLKQQYVPISIQLGFYTSE